MANEIQIAYTGSGAYVYVIIHNKLGEFYHGGSLLFETYNSSHYINYAFPLNEQGTASRYYSGDFPGVAAGCYELAFYQAAVPASPAEGDTFIRTTELNWGGTAMVSYNDVITDLTGIISRLPANLAAGRMDISAGDLGISTRDALADIILDRASGVETGFTLRQALRIILSALAGKVSGAGTTTISFRAATDSKPRITCSVDTSGNRTAISIDPT